MHELSLLENLRDIVESQAARRKFSSVVRITLEIGKLSCVEPDALRFGFDVAMQGSAAESAELAIVAIEGRGLCSRCGEESVIETLYDPCPACGNPVSEIVQGNEMKIKDLLVV